MGDFDRIMAIVYDENEHLMLSLLRYHLRNDHNAMLLRDDDPRTWEELSRFHDALPHQENGGR